MARGRRRRLSGVDGERRMRRLALRATYPCVSRWLVVAALCGIAAVFIMAAIGSADTAPPAYLQRELAGYEQKVTARVQELNDALERGALRQAERYLMPSREQVSELHRFGEALAGGTVIAEAAEVTVRWDVQRAEYRFSSVTAFRCCANAKLDRFTHRAVWAQRYLRSVQEWMAISHSFEPGKSSGAKRTCNEPTVNRRR